MIFKTLIGVNASLMPLKWELSQSPSEPSRSEAVHLKINHPIHLMLFGNALRLPEDVGHLYAFFTGVLWTAFTQSDEVCATEQMVLLDQILRRIARVFA